MSSRYESEFENATCQSGKTGSIDHSRHHHNNLPSSKPCQCRCPCHEKRKIRNCVPLPQRTAESHQSSPPSAVVDSNGMSWAQGAVRDTVPVPVPTPAKRHPPPPHQVATKSDGRERKPFQLKGCNPATEAFSKSFLHVRNYVKTMTAHWEATMSEPVDDQLTSARRNSRNAQRRCSACTSTYKWDTAEDAVVNEDLHQEHEEKQVGRGRKEAVSPNHKYTLEPLRMPCERSNRNETILDSFVGEVYEDAFTIVKSTGHPNEGNDRDDDGKYDDEKEIPQVTDFLQGENNEIENEGIGHHHEHSEENQNVDLVDVAIQTPEWLLKGMPLAQGSIKSQSQHEDDHSNPDVSEEQEEQSEKEEFRESFTVQQHEENERSLSHSSPYYSTQTQDHDSERKESFLSMSSKEIHNSDELDLDGVVLVDNADEYIEPQYDEGDGEESVKLPESNQHTENDKNVESSGEQETDMELSTSYLAWISVENSDNELYKDEGISKDLVPMTRENEVFDGEYGYGGGDSIVVDIDKACVRTSYPRRDDGATILINLSEEYDNIVVCPALIQMESIGRCTSLTNIAALNSLQEKILGTNKPKPRRRGSGVDDKSRAKMMLTMHCTTKQFHICHKCHKIVEKGEGTFYLVGGFYTAWHPHCFKCHTCDTELTGMDHRFFDEEPYCLQHFFGAVNIPKCSKCEQLIFDRRYTSAGGNSWHREHFTCHSCKKTLADTKFVLAQKKYPYCFHCHERDFSKSCKACHQPILVHEPFIQNGDFFWHSSETCLNCSTCSGSLVGRHLIFRKDEYLYCNKYCAVREM